MGTKVEYVKTDKSIWDLQHYFDGGLLYTRTSIGKFNKIHHTQSLAQCVHGSNVYIKKEIPWHERLDDFSYPLALTREDQNGEVELSAFLKEEINPDCDWFKECRPATKAELQILMDNTPE